MGRLGGQVAFVTGAARGLGRAIAIAMARDGADVALYDRCADLPGRRLASEAALVEAAAAVAALGRRPLQLIGDVRSAKDLDRAARRVGQELGHIDIVVANAGFGAPQVPFWELEEDVWNRVVDVNLTGCWLTCRATAPALIARGGGAIILISSNFGLKAMGGAAPYVASKHGVIGLAKTFAIDLAPHNIRVNAVCPGSIDTQGNREGAARMGQPFDQWVQQFTSRQLFPVVQTPDDVARVVAWLASEEARFITGHALPIDAGGTLR